MGLGTSREPSDQFLADDRRKLRKMGIRLKPLRGGKGVDNVEVWEEGRRGEEDRLLGLLEMKGGRIVHRMFDCDCNVIEGQWENVRDAAIALRAVGRGLGENEYKEYQNEVGRYRRYHRGESG